LQFIARLKSVAIKDYIIAYIYYIIEQYIRYRQQVIDISRTFKYYNFADGKNCKFKLDFRKAHDY